MNRVNGVYERDVAIHMNVIANTSHNFAGDNMTCRSRAVIRRASCERPYTNSNGGAMLGRIRRP